MISQKFIEKHLYSRSALSYFLYPISLLYSLILIIRRLIKGKVYFAPCKIISVGNIVSGGAGKTTFVIFLANYLLDKGYEVAISHRGYKSKLENKNEIISIKGALLKIAKKAGDEAQLIASKLPSCPVIVGKNRVKSIKKLMQNFPNLDYIILDDSFQHLKVNHDYDFVLFNTLFSIGNGFVLPAGILREPLWALKDASCVVINGTGKISDKILSCNKPIIRGYYRLKKIYDFNGVEKDILEFFGKKIALLSAIGLPASFEKTMKEYKIDFVEHYKFPDHFEFKNDDFLVSLKENYDKKKFDCLFITEKDYTKLQYYDKLSFPLFVVEVKFVIDNIDVLENFFPKNLTAN